MGALWLGSVGLAFSLAHLAGHRGDETSPSSSFEFQDPTIAQEAGALVPDQSRWGHPTDRNPTASTYGYTRLRFTEALGEELARLDALAESDYSTAYLGLDELTEALDAEGVLAALAYLDKSGRLEADGSAVTHLTFRLGYLLGEAGIDAAAVVDLENPNLILGWAWADPEAALAWLAEPAEPGSLRADARRYADDMWGWALLHQPERTLAFYTSEAGKAAAGINPAIHQEIAQGVARLGLEAQLEPFAPHWLEGKDPQASNLQAHILRYRARLAPEETLRSLLQPGPPDPKLNLGRKDALFSLAEEMPEAMLAVISNHSLEVASLSPQVEDVLISHLTDAALRQILNTKGLETLQAAASQALLTRMRAEVSPSEWWTALREPAPIPETTRRYLQIEAAHALLRADPIQARAELFTADDLSPELAQMVRQGRPTWELHLWLQQHQQNLIRQAGPADLPRPLY